MATQYEDIVIRVDAKGAVSVLNQAGDAVKKWDSANKAAEQGFSRFEAKIVSLQAALQLAKQGYAALTGAAQSLGAGIERGARVDDLSSAFDNLATKAGAASDVLLRQFGNAIGNVTSKANQMRMMNELMVGGINPGKFEALGKAMRALTEQTGGDATQAFDKMSDSLLRGNARALKSIGIIINEKKEIEALAKQYGKSADAITEQGRALAIRNATLREMSNMSAQFGDIQDDAGDKVQQFNAKLDDSKDRFWQAAANSKELNKALDAMNGLITDSNIDWLITELGKLGNAAILAGKTFVQMARDIKDAISLADVASPGLLAAKIAIGASGVNSKGAMNSGVQELDFSKPVQASVQAVGNLSKQIKALRRNMQAAAPDVDELFGTDKGAAAKAEKLETDIKGLKKAVEDTLYGDAFPQLTKQIQAAFADETQTGYDAMAEKIKAIGEEFVKAGGDASDFAARVKAASSAPMLGPANQTGINEWNGENKSAWDGVGKELTAAIGSAIIDGINNAKNSSDWANVIGDLGGSIGGTIGTSLGKSLGAGLGELGREVFGELGGAIGGAIGSTIIDGIVSIVGGEDSAGTKARKSVDKFFADLFNANRIMSIVDGEMQTVKDLTFQGTTSAAFDALPAQAQAAFKGVGDAWEQILGEMGYDVENLGFELEEVFAEQIGGSVADLRALIKALGKDAAEMADALYKAFYQGKISAEELMQELQGLQATMIAGIPEAVGAVDVAFKRLQEAGWSGGAVLSDAILSVAVEAQELGIKTLPELANAMVQTFGISEAAAIQFITAATATGLNSIDAIIKAGEQGAVAIAANMQAGSEGKAMTFKPITFNAPDISSSMGGASSALKSTKNDAKDAAQELRKLVEESSQYADILTKIATAEMDKAQAGKALKKLYSEVSKAERDVTAAEKQLDDYLTKHKGANIQSKKLAELEMQLERATSAMNKFKDASKSAEEQAMDAFLAGKMTFEEAMKKSGIDKGIDGFGNVTGAYKSLKDLGTKGGALSVQALKAIAAETKEAGGQTLNDIIMSLQNAGVSVGELQKFVAAAKQTGLEDVSAFLDVSNEDAVEFLGTLQQMKFPFSETTSEISKMLDKFDKLKNKKVTVDVELIISAKYRDEVAKKYAPFAKLTNYGGSSGPAIG